MPRPCATRHSLNVVVRRLAHVCALTPPVLFFKMKPYPTSRRATLKLGDMLDL